MDAGRRRRRSGDDPQHPDRKGARRRAARLCAEWRAACGRSRATLRLLLPGYEGNTNVKWLRRLKLGTEPFQTREETSKYTLLMPDGVARQFNFVMEAKSVITFPSGGQRLGSPDSMRSPASRGRETERSLRVRSVDGRRRLMARRGVAGAGHVEVPDPVPLALALDGGPATLASRVTDETGYVQPTREALLNVRDVRSYYHYNGIQNWSVAAGGAVTNAG